MSESLAPLAEPSPSRYDTADLQMLAQVEKWMAMIREFNREREQDEPTYRA